MFSVGDMVVHPMHGAGVIDGIVHEKLGGAAQDYYVFKMLVGGLLLKIPTANSDAIGLRPVSDRAAVRALFDALPGMATGECANWNKRYRENLQRLKSGDLYELARVIKGLTLRDRERSLSTGERKLLHSAKQILISEIVLSGLGSYEQVEQLLDSSMEEPAQLG